MTFVEKLKLVAELINDFRVFPRAALLWLMWIATDAYQWGIANITGDDAQWFINIIVGTAITGLIGYMGTGLKQK